MLKKSLIVSVVALAMVGAGIYAAFKLSPWPSVWLIRFAFNEGAEVAAESIAPSVPQGIDAERGLPYLPGVPDAVLDVFSPADAKAPLPVVVWVHGGGYVAGSRTDMADYLQVLAGRGFVAVAIDYTRAPTARFPTPVRQVNAALGWIADNAARFNVDPGRIFLAGDSAGAQIAAQAALVVSDPDYAARMGIDPGIGRVTLRGVVLFCGPYDPTALDYAGPYGNFMRTAIWSYIGTRDPGDARVGELSLPPRVTPDFPPAFLSVGNADPLAPQSRALAEALLAQGVDVDTLFFPEDHDPPLDHGYQLLLSTEAGHLAFERMVAFLARHD